MDKATPTPASVDSVMVLADAYSLEAHRDGWRHDNGRSHHHHEAEAALRAEVERLAAQAAPPMRLVGHCWMEPRGTLRLAETEPPPAGSFPIYTPSQAPVVQSMEAEDAVLRKHVLLMLDGMGEQVNATPSTPGNMVLQKGMRMAIGTAIDRVKSLPGAEESCTFMGEPVASPRPVGFVVLNHFGPNKHLFSSFYDTRNSEHEWAPVFADRASSGATTPAAVEKIRVNRLRSALWAIAHSLNDNELRRAASDAILADDGIEDRGATTAQAVRMLTDGEFEAACGQFHDPAKVRAAIKAFCAVNAGRTIPADGKIGGV